MAWKTGFFRKKSSFVNLLPNQTFSATSNSLKFHRNTTSTLQVTFLSTGNSFLHVSRCSLGDKFCVKAQLCEFKKNKTRNFWTVEKKMHSWFIHERKYLLHWPVQTSFSRTWETTLNYHQSLQELHCFKNPKLQNLSQTSFSNINIPKTTQKITYEIFLRYWKVNSNEIFFEKSFSHAFAMTRRLKNKNNNNFPKKFSQNSAKKKTNKHRNSVKWTIHLFLVFQ